MNASQTLTVYQVNEFNDANADWMDHALRMQSNQYVANNLQLFTVHPFSIVWVEQRKMKDFNQPVNTS